jgi:hypothetical protein
MYDGLTGKELDTAWEAADRLLTLSDRLGMEASLMVKLDTLRADLTAEKEDRRKLAES